MMRNFLLALFLIQAGPPRPAGFVSGVVFGTDGKPVENIRVFAVALRDAAEVATGPTVFEVLTQTDASGRYRLELAPGRYYIASGSVDVPTYYPGTTTAADARPVTIASGGEVNGVDFANFVTPRPAVGFGALIGPYLAPPPPPPTGTVSGVIRFQDGSPAKGMEVIAIPLPRSANQEVSSRNIPFTAVVRGRTDPSGRYRLGNIPQGDYYIVSGAREIPTLYPGTPDLANAVPVAVTGSQPVVSKDFAVSGVSMSGRVTATAGLPAIGAWIRIRTAAPRSDFSGPATLMSGVTSWETFSDRAGSYSVSGLSPGSYIVETGAEHLPPQVRNVTITDRTVNGIDFALSITPVSGRILFEDGSLGVDARAFGSVTLSRTDDSGRGVSASLPVSAPGTFRGLFEPGEYRIELRALPAFYRIKSITAGRQDLLKESLKVTPSDSVTIEIRLEK